MNAIKTKHDLDFLSDNHPFYGLIFKVGTCHGIWRFNADSYIIIAITNDKPNNGHLDDVFQWFENSCKRDKRSLKVIEIMNRDFYWHLISKRGFEPVDNESVIKKNF
jgi:hypothetical protein